jgi:hypothetical protein
MKRLMRPIKHSARLLAVLASAGLTAFAPVAASAQSLGRFAANRTRTAAPRSRSAPPRG